MLDQFKQTKLPFPKNYPFYVLIEIASKENAVSAAQESTEDSHTGGQDLDRLFKLFDSAESHILDGVVAQDTKQFDQLWFLREGVGPANADYGCVSLVNLNCFLAVFQV